MNSKDVLTARSILLPQDISALTTFFTHARAKRGSGSGYLHAGDIEWRLASNEDMNLERDGRLWFEANNLIGTVWLHGDDLELHIAPDVHGNRLETLATEMLNWADARHLENAGGNERQNLISQVHAGNDTLQRAFLHAGFERDDYESSLSVIDLTGMLPEVRLPEGFAVRSVTEAEASVRVDAHRDAFAPSQFTLEKYQRVRASSHYRPELDLAVFTPDGDIVAYALVWLADGVGLFEPVGTRSAFQGRGLGRAAIHAGLHALRDLGAHTATVYVQPDLQVFYDACGFIPAGKWLGFVKPV